MSRRGYPDLTALVEKPQNVNDETGSLFWDEGTGFWMENVAPGTWTITVLALNEDGAPIASGSSSVSVSDSTTTMASVVLFYYETGGTGGLELSLMIPKGMFNIMDGDMPPITLADVKASLHYESDGSTTALATAILPSGYDGWDMLYVSGSGLKAGAPTLNLSFKDAFDFTMMGSMARSMSRLLEEPVLLDPEEPFALYSETVWIYRNVVTRATKPIIEPSQVLFFWLENREDSWVIIWDEVLFATAYKVYTREAGSEGDYLLLGTLDVGDLFNYYVGWGGYYDNYPFDELAQGLDPDLDYEIVMTAFYGPVEGPAANVTVMTPAPESVEVVYPEIYWSEVPGAIAYKVWMQSGDDEPVLLRSFAWDEDDPDLSYDSNMYEYYFGTDAAGVLVPEMSYQFSVSAVFPYGFESEPSWPVWYYPWIANVNGFNLTWDAWPEATGYKIYLRQEWPDLGDFVLVVSLPLSGLGMDDYREEDDLYHYNFLTNLEATYEDGDYGLYISAIVGEDEGEEIPIATASYGSEFGFGDGSGFFGSSADFGD
jgi:hypothetical protein